MTVDEFNSQDYPQLHLTSETLIWDPTTTLYEQQENAMMDYSGNIVHDAATRGQDPTIILNELHLLTTDMADMTHNCNFHQVLTSHVVVSSVDASLSGHARSRKTVQIDFVTLATWWMIALEHAKKTVQLTTDRGACTCLTPRLHNDSQPMTGCFAISGFHTQPLPTHCLLVHLPVVVTNVPNCTPHPLDGQEHTP